MRKYLPILLCIVCFSFNACEDYDEGLIPLIGVYEGHVIGVSGPFSMSISIEAGDDVVIDAPFDGFNYSLVEVDTDNLENEVVDLDFCDQEIEFNTWVCGAGILSNGSLQIDYEIDFGDFISEFTIVASKL